MGSRLNFDVTGDYNQAMNGAFFCHLLASSTVSPAGTWTWQPWDTWIVVLGAIAAMSCTLPGVWLVLRQQSMMGDALSHTALPGVVITFLSSQWAVSVGWITPESMADLEPILLAVGAIFIGVLTAVLTEAIQKMGRVESSAALGVVFTTLFASGLLLLRLKADSVHIDPDCVLFGQLELAVWDTVAIGGLEVPRAVLTNLSLLIVNGILIALFFNELRLAAFDPELATSLGLSARLVNYCLMSMTAVTVVIAFTSVGSILVVAILIVPAACGWLCNDRLTGMIGTSLLIAAASAGLGHVMAKSLPAFLATNIGLTQVHDASTPGMIAVACGLFFLAVYFFNPRHSVVIRSLTDLSLTCRMSEDDVLGLLYRVEERKSGDELTLAEIRQTEAWIGPLVWNMTIWRLQRKGWISIASTVVLTESGRVRAAEVVRGHRLWESYLHKNFQLEDSQLHGSASRVEHYLNKDLQVQLEEELDSPQVDPHGKTIPPISSTDKA